MRQVGIEQHAEQTERDDVGHGVGDFALVGLNRRRHRDNRRDAADAGAGGDQRAQPRRQAKFLVEPRHEDQASGDRGQHDGQAGGTELQHIEQAQANADQHDAGPQNGGGRKLETRRQRRGKRQGVPQQQAEHNCHGHARDGTAPGEPLRGKNGVANLIREPEPRQHHDERRKDASKLIHRPTNQTPPTTRATADDADKKPL